MDIQCYENSHEAWKDIINKYEVSYEKQDMFNEVKNRWNNCRMKGTSQDPDIWFNGSFNLNIKFKKIKANYDKDEDEIKAHIFEILSEDYKPVRLSCNVDISKMVFNDLKKEISWFWKTELDVNKKR